MDTAKLSPLPVSADGLIQTTRACLANARRLIQQASLLNDESDSASTSYALAILAQEETAKAFMLFLASSSALPWNRLVHRSLRDHTCKQLWFVVTEALASDMDEYSHKPTGSGRGEFDADRRLLDKVADVLNWYRYAMIETWSQGYCDWDEQPTEDRTKEITRGKLDRKKQNALYVGIGNSGEVTSTPDSINESDAEHMIKTAELYHSYVSGLLDYPGIRGRDQIRWLSELLKCIFTPPTRTGKEIRDAIPGVVFYEESRTILQSRKGAGDPDE